jgi:hypothetical protein
MTDYVQVPRALLERLIRARDVQDYIEALEQGDAILAASQPKEGEKP